MLLSFKTKALTLLLVSIAFITIGAQEKTRIKPTLPKVEEFLAAPLSFDISKPELAKNVPNCKLKVYTKPSKNNSAIRDSFFELKNKKSKLVLYRSNKQKFIISGSITDNCLTLSNGIAIGMGRYEFFRSFADLKSVPFDTIELASKQQLNFFTFVFKNKTLTEIKIGVSKRNNKNESIKK